jgi:hypothetical protein
MTAAHDAGVGLGPALHCADPDRPPVAPLLATDR